MLWILGVALYGFAAYRYGRLCTVQRAPVALAVVAGWILLAEALLAVAISRNWHVSWWEWHLLMLLAFALVARNVWAEWKREGPAEIFADLYEERTLGHREDVSILFADLQGYTAFAERSTPDVVRAMMNDYFVTIAPVVDAEDGELVQTVGDQVFAVFRNPGHEQRASRAALQLQEVTASLAARSSRLAALSCRHQLGRGAHRPREGARSALLLADRRRRQHGVPPRGAGESRGGRDLGQDAPRAR